MERRILQALLIAATILTAATTPLLNPATTTTHQTQPTPTRNPTTSPPQTQWNKTYGGMRYDEARSVRQTADGGYIVAGYTRSFGAGGDDFWLVKTDSSGNQQWSKTYGGAGDDYAYSVQQTADGGYIVAGWRYSGGTNSFDFWLVKTDSSGNQQWNRTYGGAGDDYAYSVQQTADGGYIVAGYTWSYITLRIDYLLVRTDSAGNQQWSKTYGGTDWDMAYSVQQTADAGYIMAGITFSSGANGGDFWLVKTDSSGNQQWNKTYGGASSDYAYSVQQTADGSYIVAGRTEDYFGKKNSLLVKTDSSGNRQWNKTYGGAGDDYAYSVQQTADGGYIAAGYTDSFGAGESDFWLVKINSSGDQQWSKTCGGTDWDMAYSVQQTADAGYIMAGITFSSGANGGDFWLVKTGRETVGWIGQGTLLIVVVGGVAAVTVVVLVAAVHMKRGRSPAATKRTRAP